MLAEIMTSGALLLGPTPAEAALQPLPASSGYRRVLVTFARGRTEEGLDRIRASTGFVRRRIPLAGAVAADVAVDEIAALERSGAITQVEPDPIREASGLEDGELEPSADNGLYGLVTTNALTAPLPFGAAASTVCVADSGLDVTHPDIAPSYQGGVDAIDGDDDPSVPLGGDEQHGTHVAGTIVAAMNGSGVRGVMPGVRLIHARVLGPGERGPASAIMEGVRRLVEDHGCRVINMSLGGIKETWTETRFYGGLAARGVTVVAATGNDSEPELDFPAAYPGVISVGAVTRKNALAKFSNTGEGLDIAAPGVSVLSTVPQGAGRAPSLVLPDGEVLEGREVLDSGLVEGLVPTSVVEVDGIAAYPAEAAGGLAVVRPDGTHRMEEYATRAMESGAAALALAGRERFVAAEFTEPRAPDGREWLPVISLNGPQATKLLEAGSATVFNRPSHWAHFSGTSMASPHVAGIAALVRAARPSLTPAEVEQILESTAVDLGEPGYDTTFGAGLVDTAAALAAARADDSR